MNAVKCLVMTEQRDRSFIFHTVQSLSAHARDYGSRITTKHVFFGHHFSHECHVFLLSKDLSHFQSTATLFIPF